MNLIIQEISDNINYSDILDDNDCMLARITFFSSVTHSIDTIDIMLDHFKSCNSCVHNKYAFVSLPTNPLSSQILFKVLLK